MTRLTLLMIGSTCSPSNQLPILVANSTNLIHESATSEPIRRSVKRATPFIGFAILAKEISIPRANIFSGTCGGNMVAMGHLGRVVKLCSRICRNHCSVSNRSPHRRGIASCIDRKRIQICSFSSNVSLSDSGIYYICEADGEGQHRARFRAVYIIRQNMLYSLYPCVYVH